MQLKFDTKVVQHSYLGNYAVNIFYNILEDDYLKTLKERTLELTEEDTMRHETNVQANMTTYEKMIDDPVYDTFQKTVLSFLNTILVLRSPHLIVPKHVFYELWGMKFKKGQKTLVHHHMGAHWSGVFCIDTQENAAQINFPEMDFSENMIPNSLYLFPSMMLHSTNPYLGEKPRVAVSFNLADTHMFDVAQKFKKVGA